MNSSRKQVMVLLGLLGLVLLSVLVTSVTVITVGGMSFEGGGITRHKNVTLTDAYMDCEHKLKRTLGDQLKSFEPDNLSSRYDHGRRLYLVFFKAQVLPPSQTIEELNYVTCEVSSRGVISLFGIAPEAGQAPRDDDPFGFKQMQ